MGFVALNQRLEAFPSTAAPEPDTCALERMPSLESMPNRALVDLEDVTDGYQGETRGVELEGLFFLPRGQGAVATLDAMLFEQLRQVVR